MTSWWPRRAPYELNSSGEHGQDARTLDVAQVGRFATHARQERRSGDIRGVDIPDVAVPRGDRQGSPAVVALEDRRIRSLEERRIDGIGDHLADLGGGRPQVDEIDRPAVAILPERLGGEVEIDASGQGEGDHERRRRQIGGAGQRVDPALEVAIA